MALPNCEIEAVSIVLRGNFNPSIFQPAWLASHNLLRPEEADAAKINVIHPELTSFTAEWLILEVTKDRFSASTIHQAHAEPLRDLVLGVFTLLEHTQFTKMGMNREMHYRFASEEPWHAFGDILVPKSPWTDIIERPGLRTLVVMGRRHGTKEGVLSVKVEPSVRIRPGVFIQTNEHHEAEGDEAAKRLMGLLKDGWAEAQAYAKRAAENLLTFKGA